MTYRINVALDETTWKALQEVPRGDRSKLICEAIRTIVATRRKIKAAQNMDALRKKMPPVPDKTIISWIRQDRSR